MSDNCLFCKILKGDIPSQKVFENENVVAFKDLYPQAKIHILFIHKNHTANINEMAEDPASITHIFSAIKEYTTKEKLDSFGFRIVTNLGANAGQSVFHTHFHLLAGEKLGHFGS
jgi:histidine triad (HIT) family protein